MLFYTIRNGNREIYKQKKKGRGRRGRKQRDERTNKEKKIFSILKQGNREEKRKEQGRKEEK